MMDEWSGLADLLANLIEKYASVLDIDSLPDSTPSEMSHEKNDCGENDPSGTIAKNRAA